MIVTPSPVLNHFKHTLKNKRQSQAYTKTADFDQEVQNVQTRVNKIRNGEEPKPLGQARLSWEDEEILHQFDDLPDHQKRNSELPNEIYEPVSDTNSELPKFIESNIHIDEEL